ncbi:hypothetical protein ACFQ1S_30275 [Kibdelosporangium lantanae]|uniref:LPXTG-motif cell wall anchor domain-containing protein n=1 Tax=Kibdelosporangium lantanae TaxID=1497396 RepID=A0ABW3MFZ1_9PSEU
MKKLLFLAIGLLLLGATAVVVGIERFSLASDTEERIAQYRAKAADAVAEEARNSEGWRALQRAEPGTELPSVGWRKMAKDSAAHLDELRITGWSCVGGAVVLFGSGVVVLLVHRRRRTRSTGDAAATQVIRHI